MLDCAYITGCGVTANMPVLGTGDSGFESQQPDNYKYSINSIFGVLFSVSKDIKMAEMR